MAHLEPADAFDAYLMSGGLPLILQEWPHNATDSTPLLAVARSGCTALSISHPPPV
jgi:uncharacterized protein